MDTENWVYTRPAYKDGKIIFGNCDYKLYCYDAETGELIWDYTAGYWVTGDPVIVGNSVLFGSSGQDGDYLYCVNFDTGAFRWVSKATGEITGGAAVVDGCVYYADGGGVIRKLK